MCYNVQAFERGDSAKRKGSQKTSKKLKKVSKKVLTNRKRCAIIIKLATREASGRSLKIEQQTRESTK